MRRVRTLLVGAGSMGSAHARVAATSDSSQLVRVVDPDESRGAALADRYGVGWAPRIDDLSDVDAVILAASTEAHYELANMVLDAGKPLLVEKPVSADLSETEKLVELATREDIPLMCGYVERFNPAVLTVAPMLARPVHVSAIRHSPYAPRIRTGVAWDLLVHDVDACLRLVGAKVAGVRTGLGYFHPSSVPGAEDVAETVMTFDGGQVATASASRIGQRKIRQITIAEVDRSIEVDLLHRRVTIYRHVAHDAVTPDGLGYRQQTIIEIPELVSVREPLAAQWDHFLGLLTDGADLVAERDSILPAHRVIAAATNGG